MNALPALCLLVLVSVASAGVLPVVNVGSSYAAHAIDHSISYPAAPLVAAAPSPLVAAAPAPLVAAAPSPLVAAAPAPLVAAAPAPYLARVAPYYAQAPVFV